MTPAPAPASQVRPVVSLIKVCLLQFLTQSGNLGENIALPVNKLTVEYIELGFTMIDRY